MVITDQLAHADAFVAAWLPGSEGLGVAETLFGVAGFSGKLPLPWPSSRTTGVAQYAPLFEEGYGLTTSPKFVRMIDNVVGFNYK